METNIDLNKVSRIHFIGAGGISMSALIKLAVSFNKTCSGSDCKPSILLKNLKKQGVKIFTKHKKQNVVGAELVVYSSAIKEDNVEINFAKELNIPIIERSTFLGLIAENYKMVIAVSGAHGKTTTTAMLSNCFLRFGFNPTIHIGGEYNLISGNLNIGGKDFFITEACEFKDSFLSLRPNISVITNIEKEHLDYFKNFENIKKSFSKFCDNTSDVCFINYKYKRFIKNQNKLITFGTNKNATYVAKNLKLNCDGCYNFDCYKRGDFLGRVEMSVEGRHSVFNALAMISVADFLGVPFNRIANSLKQFSNVGRRYERLGEFNGSTVIHDYAHHPTEIKTIIKTCQESLHKPIVCVFQPHTYSRTKTLIKNFCKTFSLVDSLILVDTYSAREKYDYLGSCEHLKEEVKKNCKNINVYGVFTKKSVIKFLKKFNLKDKALLFLGAGDIEEVAKRFKTKFII